METLFALLALPEYGLSTLFVASFISATLLPVGSEPALFGLLKLNPGLFWSAIAVATAGEKLTYGICADSSRHDRPEQFYNIRRTSA